MKWLALATQVIDKIPFERLLVRRPDNKERLQELAAILGKPHAEPAEKPPEEPKLPQEEVIEEPHPANLGNLRPKVHLASREGGLSTEETVVDQNREMGKHLLEMETHCAQKFHKKGKPCDCGQSRHILMLEGLSEETIAMVDNPDIYYRIIALGKELEPKCTLAAITSGQYDNEYPVYSQKYRDCRKELIGRLEPEALFPEKHIEEVTELPATQEIAKEEFGEQHKDLLTQGIIT